MALIVAYLVAIMPVCGDFRSQVHWHNVETTEVLRYK